MKVYVITSGEYSDYHIDGVAVDKEIAEKIKEYAGGYDARIETYETDAFIPLTQGREKYFVQVYENGQTVVYENVPQCNENDEIVVKHAQFYTTNVWAIDEEHAKKIAWDRVAEYKYRERVNEAESIVNFYKKYKKGKKKNV